MLSRAGRPELAVVIVNFQSWGDVATLVGLLARSPRVGSGACEVLVVDNASGQPVPESLAIPIPGVRLLSQPRNGGFSAGVNAGWHAARSPWLLVLNPDIVPNADFLDQVLSRIEALGARSAPRPGVVGFALRNPDGTRQPSVGAFPSLVRTVWEQVLPRPRRKYQPEWRLRAGPVDWVTGACFLVSTTLLEAVGGMDEDFFLYHEEVALCRSAHWHGFAVEYDPGVAVIHLRPLQNRAISPKMRVITRHSKLLYFRKHRPRWEFVALAWAIQAEAKVRGTWCRLRGQAAARTWQAVAGMAGGFRAGAKLKGPAVLALAEAADDPIEGDRAGRTRPGTASRAASAARRGFRRARGTRPTSP